MKFRGKLVRIALGLLLTVSLLYYSLAIISKTSHVEVPRLQSREQLFPPRIFTFWHTEPTGMIKKLIDSWKVTNHTITVLNHSNYKLYTDSRPTFDISQLMIQHQADWIRIAVLQSQGGYWIDAAVLLTRPLNEIEEIARADEADCFAYDLSKPGRKYPIIDNFFIASRKQGLFATAWLLEYTLALKTDYIKDLTRYYDSDRLFEGVDDVEYFKMNIAAQKLIQVNQIPVAHSKGVKAPFIMYDNYPKYDAKEVAKKYLGRFQGEVPVMLKFTHQVREQIQELLKAGYNVHPESIYAHYLG